MRTRASPRTISSSVSSNTVRLRLADIAGSIVDPGATLRFISHLLRSRVEAVAERAQVRVDRRGVSHDES